MKTIIALKSSIISLVSQMISILLTLLCTRIFVLELGTEIRGLNGLITNCVGILALSDLGIGIAITYALYQPLVEDNKKEIAVIMKLYKRIYYFIGVAVFCMGIVMSFFLDYFIKNSTYNWNYIIVLFYIQLLCTVSTYFLGAYKRNLLYADQKQYIISTVDTISLVIFSIIKILVLMLCKSYILFMIIQIIQTVGSNITISFICDRIYPFLKEDSKEKYDKLPQLITNIKNIFFGRLGAFVYCSTDNLIISRFLGVIEVGLMANYYDVFNVLNALASSITSPIQPMIGNYIREYKDIDKSYDLFLVYTFIRYCIANIVSVSAIVMIIPFIQLWLGDSFIMPLAIPILMAVDVYISVVHGSTGEYLSVLGLFKNDRNMNLIGMVLNLVFSIILVKEYGSIGVLIGTIISQLYYWVARAYVVFTKYFKKGICKYITKVLAYTMLTVFDVIILVTLRNILYVKIDLKGFILMCCICVFVEIVSIILFFGRTKEFAVMMQMICKWLKK
ncbi:MAG: oligosaccharide flippase family protein [Lachnospiraceae bacterium]|nr:oligosaccharide flippase family protein [Lachnospiraceae bacterium]